jgi:hypothetical protein
MIDHLPLNYLNILRATSIKAWPKQSCHIVGVRLKTLPSSMFPIPEHITLSQEEYKSRISTGDPLSLLTMEEEFTKPVPQT